MKQLGISIIGTDTDVGKTFVTGLLGAMAVDALDLVEVVERSFIVLKVKSLCKGNTRRRTNRAL